MKKSIFYRALISTKRRCEILKGAWRTEAVFSLRYFLGAALEVTGCYFCPTLSEESPCPTPSKETRSQSPSKSSWPKSPSELHGRPSRGGCSTAQGEKVHFLHNLQTPDFKKVSNLIIDCPQAGGWRHPERLRSKHRDRGIPAFPTFPRNLRWERLRRCRGLWEIKSRKRKTKNKESLNIFLFSAPSACKERMLVPIGIEIYRGM